MSIRKINLCLLLYYVNSISSNRFAPGGLTELKELYNLAI